MDKHIRDVIGVKLEPTIGVDPASFDRELETMLVFSPAPSAAYALAAAIEREMAMSGEVFVTAQRRPGDTLFDIDVLDALAAAEIVVEDTPRGVILHLPNHAGSVNGRGLAQMLSPPLTAADFAVLEKHPAPPPQDYLRHDPTKRHNRRRKPR